jgi:YVTN family beta-propeller protein
MALLYLIVGIQLFIKIPNEISNLVSMKMQQALEGGAFAIPSFFVLMFFLFIPAILKMKGKVKLSFVIIAVFLFVSIMILWPLAWAFAVKPPVRYTAYVSDFRGNVLLGMDTETNRTTARIGVGAGPDSLAVASGETEIWVANWRNDTVSVVDTRSNSVTATISVGKGPRNVTMSPSGGQAWVSNQFNQSVSVVDVVTKQVVDTISVGIGPGPMVFTVDGKKVCVVNTESGTVSIINTETYKVEKNISVGSFPEDIAVDHHSDEQWTYATSRGNNSVTVINAAKEERAKVVSVGMNPCGVAVNGKNGKVYVVHYGIPDHAGYVIVFDIATDKIFANITVEEQPCQPLLSPDQSRLYVANSWSSSISVIDTVTNELITTIKPKNDGLRNSRLRSMAITLDGNQICVTYEASGWISIVDTVTYAVRNVQVGISLREVVFVKK